MIRPQRLDAFYFVMTTGSVSAAARALRLSQPSVSRLIRELEAETGLELFTRRQGRVFPNDVAHELIASVSSQFAALHAVESKVEELAGRRTLSFGIASLPSLAGSVLPRALASHRLPPGEYKIRTIENHDLMGFIAANPDYLCITSDSISDPRFEVEILIEMQLVMALPAGHALARKPVIRVEDLAGATIARADGADGVFNQIDAIFERHGMQAQVRFRSNRSDVLYGLVEASQCFAVVEPFGYLRANQAAVVIRPFVPALPIVYRFTSLPMSRRSRETRLLKSIIRETVRERAAELRQACTRGVVE